MTDDEAFQAAYVFLVPKGHKRWRAIIHVLDAEEQAAEEELAAEKELLKAAAIFAAAKSAHTKAKWAVHNMEPLYLSLPYDRRCAAAERAEALIRLEKEDSERFDN